MITSPPQTPSFPTNNKQQPVSSKSNAFNNTPGLTQNKVSTNSTTISQSEITSILSACTNNFRFDGRSNLHIRPYTLLKSTTTNTNSSNVNVSSISQQKDIVTPILSNGSSRLYLPGSNTDVICSIKADIVHPPQYQVKNEGLIELNIDILPFASSSSSMDRRNVRKEEMEVTSTLMHLLIPHLVDKEQLVIIKGRYVWRLYIDVLVMHCDGNLMDVCSMAIWGAMQNVKLPHVVPVIPLENANDEGTDNQSTNKSAKKASDELLLDGDITKAVVPDGVSNCPIVITVSLLPKTNPRLNKQNNDNTNIFPERHIAKGIDCVLVVDANKQEELCATTKVSISVDPKGNTCGIHKYGNSSVLLSNGCEDSVVGTIPFNTLSQVQNAAISASKSVFDLLQVDSLHPITSDGVASNFFRGHFELH